MPVDNHLPNSTEPDHPHPQVMYIKSTMGPRFQIYF